MSRGSHRRCGSRLQHSWSAEIPEHLATLRTPNSEPALSLLAKGAFGPPGPLEAAGAPGAGPVPGPGAGPEPVRGACNGGLDGPVRELREPLAPAAEPALTPTFGGGDWAFRSSSLGAMEGAPEDVVPSEVCRLRVALGRPCEGGCCDEEGGGGAFLDFDLNKNDMAFFYCDENKK